MSFGVKSVTGATVFQHDEQLPQNQEQNVSAVSVVGTDGSVAIAQGSITFVSADDSNVKVHVDQNGSDVVVTIGVYYK